MDNNVLLLSSIRLIRQHPSFAFVLKPATCSHLPERFQHCRVSLSVFGNQSQRCSIAVFAIEAAPSGRGQVYSKDCSLFSITWRSSRCHYYTFSLTCDNIHTPTMYFRNVLCTVAFATLASAAVAKQIPTPYSSESYEDEVLEREAEADPARTAAWEEAHGGAAPSYHYGEEHDAGAWHIARDAEPMAEAEARIRNKAVNWASWLSSALPSGVKKAIPTVKPLAYKGGLKKPRVRKGPHKNKYYNPKHARDVEDEDDAEFDDEDFEDVPEVADLHARDIEVPDFGDQEVDTSLEGLLEARDVGPEDEGEEEEFDFEDVEEDESELAARDVGEEEADDYEEESVDESNEDLTGYDEEILQRRSEGTDNEVDYSLEGYDENIDHDEDYEGIAARDVEDDDQFDDQGFEGDDDGEVFARSIDDEDEEVPDFGDEEVDTSLGGLLEARDVEGGAEGNDFDDSDYDEPFLNYDDDDSSLSARGVDDETLEDADDVDNNADAAYADAEVVEELEAPAVE